MLLIHVGSIYFGGIKTFWSGDIERFFFKYSTMGTDVHIQQHIHQKDLYLYRYCSVKKNKNKKLNCVMILIITSSSTLQFIFFLFVFLFQWMSLINLSLIKFWKFLVIYLGCGCVIFDFTLQMCLSNLLPMFIHEWKTWVQRPPKYSKMLRNICKKEF